MWWLLKSPIVIFGCWGWARGGVGHSNIGDLYTLVMVVSPNCIIILWMSISVMEDYIVDDAWFFGIEDSAVLKVKLGVYA